MTLTPDQQMREAILDGYDLEMENAAQHLFDTMQKLSELGDELHVLALDELPQVADGSEMPVIEAMVAVWNTLVRVREELDRAQKAWRKLDHAAMNVSVVRHLPYYQAMPRISGEVTL